MQNENLQFRRRGVNKLKGHDFAMAKSALGPIQNFRRFRFAVLFENPTFANLPRCPLLRNGTVRVQQYAGPHAVSDAFCNSESLPPRVRPQRGRRCRRGVAIIKGTRQD